MQDLRLAGNFPMPLRELYGLLHGPRGASCMTEAPQKKPLSAKVERLKVLAKRLDDAEEKANQMFLDLLSGKTDLPNGGSIMLTLRALCINTMHYIAEDLKALDAAASEE